MTTHIVMVQIKKCIFGFCLATLHYIGCFKLDTSDLLWGRKKRKQQKQIVGVKFKIPCILKIKQKYKIFSSNRNYIKKWYYIYCFVTFEIQNYFKTIWKMGLGHYNHILCSPELFECEIKNDSF